MVEGFLRTDIVDRERVKLAEKMLLKNLALWLKLHTDIFGGTEFQSEIFI